MKQFAILLFVCASSYNGLAQASIELSDRPFVIQGVKNEEIQKWLEALPSFSALSKDEKDMLYWVNVLRKNPREFHDKYVTEFIRQYPEVKGGNTNSLKSDLYKLQTLPLLNPNELLQKEALAQATDIAKNQTGISHNTSGGKNFQQRMQDRGITKCAGENIYEGRNDALKALILLLIDEHVSGLGHRKALLESRFDLFGSASVPRGEKYIIVQDFSCQ